MDRSYANEVPLDVRPLGIPLSTTGRIESWLVAEGDQVQADSVLARLTLGQASYELRLRYSGKVDLIQTGAGEPVHQGIALLQIISDAPPPSLGVRLVPLAADQLR